MSRCPPGEPCIPGNKPDAASDDGPDILTGAPKRVIGTGSVQVKTQPAAASETPRTDHEAKTNGYCGARLVHSDWGRTLERELAAAKAEITALEAQSKEWKQKYLLLSAQHGRLCDQVYEDDGETLKQTTLEAQLAEARKDQERWVQLRNGISACRATNGSGYFFVLPKWITEYQQRNLQKGSVAEHLNDIADAALSASRKP